MEYVFESGEKCLFSLVQQVQGVEYIPDEANYTVRDRKGTLIQSGFLDGNANHIEFDAPEVTERSPYWLDVSFSSGSYAGKSKLTFEVAPFRGIAASPDQARRLLGIDDLVLPDTEFDFDSQYESLVALYPDLKAIENLDKLVLLSEVTRLARTAPVWLPKSTSQDDVKLTRNTIDFEAYRRNFEAQFYSELFRLLPDLESDSPTPTILQFVPITDPFTGE